MTSNSIFSAKKVVLLFLGLIVSSSGLAGEEQRVQALLLKKQEEIHAIEAELSNNSESAHREQRLQAKLRRLQGELKNLQKRQSSFLETKD